ncbi:MAG TPA: hypothetical protein VGR88_09365 [Ktedonobacterales bacterium]|nr:hypothetical protein [Ktedonobacterales bacterium]
MAQANRQMSAQARDLEKRQQQMRLATQEIQRVHAALARGDWSARARVDERDLLPIATSLNLLLDRLTRLIQRDTQHARQEQATHQLALAIQMWRSGQPGKLPEYTGTALDEVILELETPADATATGWAGRPNQRTVRLYGTSAASPTSMG